MVTSNPTDNNYSLLTITLLSSHIVVPSSAAITSYIRYREVEYHAYGAHMTRANKATLFLGLMSALGISIVGNFQVSWVLLVLNIFKSF